jgi:DNA (cytosine-5)-methyltransferase 1
MFSNGSAFADFFSGSGIMSYGFKKNGFTIANGYELNPERCITFNRNLSTNVEPVDLFKIDPGKVRCTIKEYFKELAVVTGCPPCQSFSSLHRTRGIPTDADSRTRLVEKYGQLAVSLRPKIIVFENVGGILSTKNRPYFDSYLKILYEAGYETDWKLIDAADYGVPQHRKRVVAISILRELRVPPSFPSKTHSKEGGNGTKKWKTVKSAIKQLRPLEPGETDPNDKLHSAALHSENTLRIIRAIPKDGGSRKSLPEELVLPCHRRLAKNKGAESVYGRMKWEEPSPTITRAAIRPSSGRFIHPEQDRGITLREMACLQTIPDSYKFEGSKEAIASMIGDAVPFELAKTIAIHVKFLLKEAGD